MRIFELGERVPMKKALREVALPFMADLYALTHHTVHLAVLDGPEIIYIERIHGGNGLPQLPSRVGGRLPAHCTGLGKALLAFGADLGTEVITTSKLEARTPYTITSRRLLLDELARIRHLGLATDREESAAGVHCVAAPIVVAATAVAALSVAGPPERMDADRIGLAVRSAALGLQRTLGTARPPRSVGGY